MVEHEGGRVLQKWLIIWSLRPSIKNQTTEWTKCTLDRLLLTSVQHDTDYIYLYITNVLQTIIIVIASVKNSSSSFFYRRCGWCVRWDYVAVVEKWNKISSILSSFLGCQVTCRFSNYSSTLLVHSAPFCWTTTSTTSNDNNRWWESLPETQHTHT